MSSSVRIEYPDFSTETELSEFFVTGDTLDVASFKDRRAIIEVKMGDDPVKLTGGSLDDTITGGAGNDTIIGGPGKDILTSGDNNDVLNIDCGDTVSSGSGIDIIKFDLSQEFDPDCIATITDFEPGADKIEVIGLEGEDNEIIYNSDTGSLFANGREIIKIDNKVVISAEDLELPENTEPLNVVDNEGDQVYRFFNAAVGTHFYTADEVEKDYVIENLPNYQLEEGGYRTVDPTAPGAEEVYRFFNPSTGVHLYTTDEFERDYIIENLANFVYEDVKFYAYEVPEGDETPVPEDAKPVYRFYEPTLGVHFYTPNETEKDSVIANLDNYSYENIAFYAYELTSALETEVI
jgi:translation elongation factor P/translation initiation factor 5A